ncbi:MAG: hypothetical protein HY053_08010 [Proteobacteria bacterium]|nr:hypothetical protein [Pseudomonadota bacterium]
MKVGSSLLLGLTAATSIITWASSAQDKINRAVDHNQDVADSLAASHIAMCDRAIESGSAEKALRTYHASYRGPYKMGGAMNYNEGLRHEWWSAVYYASFRYIDKRSAGWGGPLPSKAEVGEAVLKIIPAGLGDTSAPRSGFANARTLVLACGERPKDRIDTRALFPNDLVSTGRSILSYGL